MVTDRYYSNLRFAVPGTLFYLPKPPTDNGRCAQFKKLYVLFKTIIVLEGGLCFFNTIRVLETGGENMMDGSTINTRTSGNCDRGSSRQ